MKAARLVLNELRDAEAKIDIISEKLNSRSTSDLPSVLPTNNWRTYSHLFVSYLDTDEFRLINAFYTACEIVHDAAMRNNNFFWITTEERAKVIQQMLKDPDISNDTLNKIANRQYQYTPQKTLDLMDYHLRRIDKITIAPCGEKLKKIARVS